MKKGFTSFLICFVFFSLNAQKKETAKDTVKGRPSFTNWNNLPSLMQGYDLNEEGFKSFVASYISSEKDNE